MKRFIATHTFHSEEARAGYYKAISEMPDETYLTTPNAICLQVFNSDSDFFFCHWVARSEQDIQTTLDDVGMDKFFITMATEIIGVIDNKDEPAREYMKFE